MKEADNKDIHLSLVDTELIYQNAPNGYISILPDSTIIKLNDTMLGWLGYTRDEVVGQMKFGGLLSKGGTIHFEMFFRPMITVNGNVKELNYEIQKKDGSSFPALLNATGVFNAEKILLAVNIDLTDITQRNLYEKDLLLAKNNALAEKEKFELLAALSPEIIWTVGYHGNMNFLNEWGKTYLGIAEVTGAAKVVIEKIHPDDKAILREYWLSENPPTSYSVTIRLQDRSGKYRWFEMKIISANKSSIDVKWFGTCTNIEDHVASLQKKDEFIHLASHELNTPITVLYSYLQLMRTYEQPEAMNGYLDKSVKALKNVQFLISTLLNVSAINSGVMKLALAEFSLNELLVQIVEQFNVTFPEKTIEVFLPSQEMCVLADKGRITQVITNLINNAIKYSSPETPVKVRLEPDAPKKSVAILVQDFGIGIAPENVSKIFDRYFREGSVKNISGLGLGLYITQNIINAHGSELAVYSEVSVGSVFSFKLPLID